MSKNWYPVINKEWCDGCGDCLKKCTHGVFANADGKPVVVQPDNCVEGCHRCGKLCPTGAISYVGDKGNGSGGCCCDGCC